MERYALIANELQLGQSIIEKIRDDLFTLLEGDKSNPEQYLDAVKASGEDNNAKLIAAYFRYKGVKAKYVNPKDAGLFVTNEPGNAQVLPESYQNLYRLRERDGLIIFPGFFGFSKDGDVITFSRSGSDITGSILPTDYKPICTKTLQTWTLCILSIRPSLRIQRKSAS